MASLHFYLPSVSHLGPQGLHLLFNMLYKAPILYTAGTADRMMQL